MHYLHLHNANSGIFKRGYRAKFPITFLIAHPGCVYNSFRLVINLIFNQLMSLIDDTLLISNLFVEILDKSISKR